MTQLQGIDFGPVWGASGVQGFFGEGYWWHPFFKLFGLNFTGVTFVAKTATLTQRQGNMHLDERYRPKEWLPNCIASKPFRGAMLNAVGLSNPGLQALLDTGLWQKRDKPFFISVMSLAETPEKRFKELMRMVGILSKAKSNFSAPFGLQINLSCPNTGHDPCVLIGETAESLAISSELGVPLVPKFSIASAPIDAILELENNSYCDGICVSNTIPFGWKKVDWEHIWGSTRSPLELLGGGGLSGAPLLPLVCEWITELRRRGFSKPINGGGGIMRSHDVQHYCNAGVNSVFIGTVAALRPWQVKRIVHTAHNVFTDNNGENKWN